jgi:cobalt-zinc-cadmium efflux system membrane fusion protein
VQGAKPGNAAKKPRDGLAARIAISIDPRTIPRKRDGMKLTCMLCKSTAVLLLIFAGLTVPGCRHQTATDSEKGSVGQSSQVMVHYVAAEERPIADHLDLSAKVQADPARMFRIFPPASGRVLALKVKPGDIVTRGERLALIDSADAASAQSDLAKAQIEAERAQRAADREKVLLDHGAVAEKDYLDAKAAADSAQAELVRAKQHLAMLGVNAGSNASGIPLLAPGPGIVLTVNAAAGEFSKSLDNADPLMTIADLSTVWVMGDVFEKDIAKVQPGTKVTVTVDAFPGRQLQGRIDSLAGALDPVTRTLKVRVALPNPGEKMKPEMFAAIHVDVGSHNSIVVPASAIVHEGQNTIVFVENAGKPEQLNVTTGQAVDGKVEIASGVRAGQRVAVDGAELLTGGSTQP